MKRLLLAIPTLIGISLIVFFISQLIPGSPIAMEIYKIRQAGAPGVDTEKLAAELAKQYDFDKPLPVRYFKWLKGMATLDFGISIKDNRPVWDKIAERVPVSLQISFISLLLAYLIAIPIGVYSSVKQDTWSEGVLTVFLFILYSLPNFWVATLLMMFLCGGQFWNVFPIAGMSSRGAESLALLPWLLDRVWHLALPVACMTYGSLAFLSRFAKSGCWKSSARITSPPRAPKGFRKRR
jgi:peptide/nickel transport system permease protein